MKITIPTSAVQLTGEDGAGVALEPGDAVTVTLEGKVVSSTPNSTEVAADLANGQPLPPEPEVPPMEPTLDQEEAGLMSEARQGGNLYE